MKSRIIVAVIFVPLLFIVLYFLPPIALTIVVAAIGALAAFELLRSVSKDLSVSIYTYAIVAACVIPFGVWLGIGDVFFRVTLFLLMALMFFEAIISFNTDRKIKFEQIAIVIFAGVLIPYFLSALISLKSMPSGKFYVLLPFVAAFISDAGAYFTGVFLGKHKVAPHISPKKTVEGCIGGLVSAIVFMVVYGIVLKNSAGLSVSLIIMGIYGFLGSLVTQLGDLSFSMIKREYGIKDYGNLLPGHGGMLDRFDSMIFAAPAIYILVVVIPAF